MDYYKLSKILAAVAGFELGLIGVQIYTIRQWKKDYSNAANFTIYLMRVMEKEDIHYDAFDRIVLNRLAEDI